MINAINRLVEALSLKTLRKRLVFGFSALLGAMMFFVGLSLYLVERTTGWQRELGRVADGFEYVLSDTSATRPPIMMMFRADGQVFLESDFVERELSAAQIRMLADLDKRAGGGEVYGVVDLGGRVGRVRYYVRPVVGPIAPGRTRDPGFDPDTLGAVDLDTIQAQHATGEFEPAVAVTSILVGLVESGVNLAPQRILSAIVLMAPFIIAISIVFGYLVVGQTLRPVDRIVNEADAIRDGRSLHRRLAGTPGGSEDELARLTTTINGMLGRLEASFKSLRRFTADASHELKTPLTILKTGLERALTHPATPAEILVLLEESLTELNRMVDLTDSLLVLARADEGSAPLHLEEVELRDLLTEVAETASLLGEQGSVAIDVQIPAESVTARLDPSRIRQLLLNLLGNAVKYTPKGGRARLEFACNGAEVVFTITDTGIGIAPGDLPHIFDRFWRIDPARSSTGRRPGTGLGLAITRWIAEAHGGSVTARSRPGRGSTFVVRLPRQPAWIREREAAEDVS